MKKQRITARILCVLLASVMLLAIGCDNVSDETTAETNVPETTAEATETEEEETDPPETEEIVNMIKISDKMEMPEVTHMADTEYVTANLNSILKDGYGTKSLMADAFAKVFDRLVILRTGTSQYDSYVLGQKHRLGTYATTKESGHYVSLFDVADIFGGEYEFDPGDGENPKTKVTFGDRSVVCEGDEATLTAGGETAEADISKNNRVLGDSEDYTDIHLINVKDAAKLVGINVYCTDSGIICFSAGKAFDDLRGYYVAEEAEKLFLEEAEAEEFSHSMFVDIPNIIKFTENNVAAYSFPDLDLGLNVLAYASQGVTAKVSLGPAIVAGQGENDENYTVVRVFDIYQTCQTQFNAYPASVRGGVQVAAAVTADGVNILTAPFRDATVSELLVYDVNGSFRFSIKAEGKAPYAIAAGAFTGGDDVFAVAPATGGGSETKVALYSAENGSKVGDITVAASGDRLVMSANRAAAGTEGLVLSFGKKAYEYKDGKLSEIELDGSEYNGVYASAFGGYAATSDADDEYKAFSGVTEYKDGAKTVLNAGVKENIFVSTKASKNTDYIKKGEFWHTRVEYPSPVMGKLKKTNTTAIRTNDIKLFTISAGGNERNKYNKQYNMWEPCSTHRWGKTQQMGYLIDYVDPDTGTYAYATLTKTGERNDYLELGSSFYNATYAPNIPALDRLNFWTRRTYMQSLAELYRQAPEYTVAVSPVHEHEIDSGAKSVGDYNPKMVSGFASWMRDMYGTIENVNKKFGTDFKSFDELDAPRGAKRGDWDKYSTKRNKNAYFTAWTLYNRYIVSRHVIQSYREALLAGFPPELIKAHQIPEGDAVAGLLGEADTRISPVDVVLADGTGYGGTRYGVWYGDKNSFFSLADRSGQNNITLGEYSAMSMKAEDAYDQLKYMFDHGIVFTHVMSWAGNATGGDVMDKNEQYAIDTLQQNEEPRSASSGGTGDLRAYVNGDTAYNIVEIGSKPDSAGLLKSIKADGSFDGTVYLQPFHAFVGVVDIERDGKANGSGTLEYKMTGKVDADGKELSGFNYNDTAELRITAAPTGRRGTITVRVIHDGYEMPVAAHTFTVTGEAAEYRYVFKNQVFLEDCTIVVEYSKVDMTDIDVVMMYEMTARKYYGETSPKAHEGGVSFDIIY
ncbi:MAG: beta-galactosidase [Clostridia bacterium]|nr:beta-galactosidase [Clostridia bacterium]